MGVRNDQTGERDRGVQYGLHTVTGLCGGPEGGGQGHKDLSVRLYAQKISVIVGAAGRKKGIDSEGWGVGGRQWSLVCLSWDSGQEGPGPSGDAGGDASGVWRTVRGTGVGSVTRERRVCSQETWATSTGTFRFISLE